jgi:hypothetical protein
VKRTVLAIGSALVMIAFSVTLGGAAWSASRAPAATHGSCGCSTTTTTTPATTTTTAPPPTTTTTTVPTTTTTTTAPPTTTTLPVPRPITGTGTQPPPAAAVPTTPATISVSVPLTQLPFTGRSLKPFLFAGVLLVGVGLALLAPSEFWRRGTRLLSARLPSGFRRASLALRRLGAPSVVGWSFLGI